MRFKTKSKDVLYKKTGITKPDAKTLMLDAVGMLPTLMGAPISTTKALQQLGKSARKISLKGKSVRDMAANIRRSPKEALEPLTSVGYKGKLGKGTTGQNVRDLGSKTSRIDLAPTAGKTTWFHELPHSTAHATKGDISLQGYLSDLLETSTSIGKDAVTKAQVAGKMKIGRSFYKDQPIESHARLTSWALRDKSGKITGKEYTEDFNRAAKVVMERVKKQSPTLYKKTLKAVTTRRLKEGKLPETFDEWMESITVSPKSKKLPTKKTKIKKKLTPGEIARVLQDAAEAKGPPRYMRRKAD